MDNKKENESKICVLVWDANSTKPRLEKVPAVGDVPAAVWEALNKAFLKRLAKGWFAPLEPADAYHFVVEKVLEKAAQRTDLTGVVRTNYLLGVMYSSLTEFGSHKIAPARQNARSLTNWQKGTAKRLGLAEDEIDTAALLERMPYVSRPSDTHSAALRTLEEILPRLPQQVRETFLAYLATDGNFYAMSARLGVPVRTLYRKWKRYLLIARHIATAGLVKEGGTSSKGA